MFEKVITRAFEMVSEQIKLTQAKNDYPVNVGASKPVFDEGAN